VTVNDIPVPTEETAMLADEEIERRVTTDDTPVTARRIAIAQKVSALGAQIAVVSGQLQDLIGQARQEIGDNQEIITIEKLATYTDIPKAHLKQWLVGYKPAGNKRKRQSADEPAAGRITTHTKAGQLAAPEDHAQVRSSMTAEQGSTAETSEGRKSPALR
jgi:hypothetical protein